jgi:lysophospholipase L1-like esterase
MEVKTIVLQGDSITDANRNPQFPESSGNGYATMVKGWLGCEYPGQYHCYNRGVAGNRIGDLYARIREDIINLKPDIVSLLIGVNDVWSDVDGHNGTDTKKFEMIYDQIVQELLAELPGVQIMILEPYVINGDRTCNDETHPDRWEFMSSGVREKAAAARRIAEKYGIVFVELQSAFEKALESAPVSHWLPDGVHPTSAGHELIKRQWLKGFQKLIR